ncbi:alpha-N-acetylgalactosaminidase [Tritrichomonas foetus]|uniref:Alpha-N-acetylgalactosaminidase n=1 Tax=Tritrichomonas foetus TaxID=1144522 RepID=A0A1J4JIC5_9EUKA|nr:alpha-N-acetylgalactosaminidase [Tritrichomonas foetus]|eukprot:OHS97299.1 alpha-N-acetylgalactosaminidase [Tritrichomonas foetus]
MMIFFLCAALSFADNKEIELKNDFINQIFNIADNHVGTKAIYNYRTNSMKTITPEEGSEEWILSVYKPESSFSVTPLDRSKWKVTANNEQTTKAGVEGAAVNLIDGNPNTLWHSKYNDQGEGGHDDRKNKDDPYIITFDFSEVITFSSFSHLPRNNLGNGVIYHFEIYIGSTLEELNSNIEKQEYILKDDFDFIECKPIYFNFKTQITTQYLAFLSVDHGNYGSGADFSLYSEVIPLNDHYIKSSNCLLEKYDLSTQKESQLLKFIYSPYVDSEQISYQINVTYELQNNKHYIEKQISIICSEPKQRFSYIDLTSMKISNEDFKYSFTHPNREQYYSIPRFYITLGQPVYINTLFTGSRFPLSDNQIVDHTCRLRYHSGKTFEELLLMSNSKDSLQRKLHSNTKLNDENIYYCWKTVLGTARSELIEVVRSDFFSYIDDISVITKFRRQYNSWYDWMLEITESNILESFKEIEKGCSSYGVPPLDSYVVDDGWNNYNSEKYGVYDVPKSGTTYNQNGFWEFNSKFPDGLTKPSHFASTVSSNFGVWLGPRGGYNYPRALARMIEDAGKGYLNSGSGDVDVGSHRYIDNLSDFLNKWVEDYRINYFKLDGFSTTPCMDSTHDHIVGGVDGAYYYTDLWERYFKMFERLRQTADRLSIPNLWISITCYVNPSPFHLQWANSVWLQISSDVGYTKIGNNDNYCDQMLTFRDGVYYKYYEYYQFQFPQRCIYNHDPIYGKTGTKLEGSMNDDEFRSYLFGCGMRGTAFFELYYTYGMIDEGDKWYVNSEVLKWIEEHYYILQHSQRFGSDPDTGSVYGYSAWNGTEGIISIRNPSTQSQNFSIKLNRDIGVPENIPTTYTRTALTHNTIETIVEGVAISYNDIFEVSLQPFEHRIIEFHPQLDKSHAEIEVFKPVSQNEVLIRFNKRIILDPSQFQFDNDEIKDIRLRADFRTVSITLENPMMNNTEYTLSLTNVADQFGNVLSTKARLTYMSGLIAAFIPNAVVGDDSSINDFDFDTDAFSIQLNIKELNITDATLIYDEKKSLVVEVINRLIKFTFNDLSVTSQEEVHDESRITLVRERNGMLKIYIDGTLSSSAYERPSSEKAVKVNLLRLVACEVSYNSVFLFNKGLSYKESLGLAENQVILSGASAEATTTADEIANSPKFAIDNNENTFWLSSPQIDNNVYPQFLTIKLDRHINVEKLRYIPHNDESAITEYNISVSNDGEVWTFFNGTFRFHQHENIQSDEDDGIVVINQTLTFIRIAGKSAGKTISVSEVYIYGNEVNIEEEKPNNNATGVIIGLVVGTVAALLFITAIYFYCKKRIDEVNFSTAPLISNSHHDREPV